MKSGTLIELSARYFGNESGLLKLFLIDYAQTARIIESKEALGEWREAKVGDTIRVRISSEYAAQAGIGSTPSINTGKRNGPVNG